MAPGLTQPVTEMRVRGIVPVQFSVTGVSDKHTCRLTAAEGKLTGVLYRVAKPTLQVKAP
jgi:hypothetical protein